MFTSENKITRISLRYLLISIVLAAAGAIYEHFSFGVYSYFMIYAFAIPLIGGALPFMLKSMHRGKPARNKETAQNEAFSQIKASGSAAINAEWIWHMGIATLTVGSIVQGILAISGRPNSLTVIYLIAGILLIASSAILKKGRMII